MRQTVLLVGAALLVGCSPGSAAETTTTTSSTTTIPTTTTTTLPLCRPATVDLGDLDTGDLHGASIAWSTAVWSCANEVGVAEADADAIATAASLGLDGPLLVDGPGIGREVDRLGARRVVWVGANAAPAFATEAIQPDSAVEREQPADDAGTVWVATDDATTAFAATVGASVLRLDGVDEVGTDPGVVTAMRDVTALTTVGLDEDTRATLERLRFAPELPGGGVLFDDVRLVAFYGNPTTPFLGVLGEQDPAGTLARILPIAAEYEADGLRSIPTFEIIATVASARAGADDDYSDEGSVGLFQPWVDFAAENDVYVVLDLQPGRTDFLTQAKRYEELLRLPNVGLALDPEWRLGQNQVHLRQIGTVDAAEINEVSRWLADLVRAHQLPQKYFIVHQFRFSMITNRETIETPPELFTVIQMDGQGPLPTKYETYAAITSGQDGVGWSWGWKNFYDEDSPMATPGQVLDVDPVPVFVSFQ